MITASLIFICRLFCYPSSCLKNKILTEFQLLLAGFWTTCRTPLALFSRIYAPSSWMRQTGFLRSVSKMNLRPS